MSDWAEGQIGDLATGVRGVAYTPDQLKEASDESTVTLLRANNIQSGALHFNDVQFVADIAVSDAQVLTPGDIAVCMSNGSRALVGKAAQYKPSNRERTTVGAFCSLFRPTSSAHPGYVSYLFQSQAYRAHLDLILAGSAINNLRNKDIEALTLLIAPKREQSAIARILDILDTQIEKTQALIAKLEQVKEGLLHDLLTRGVDENGELRPSAEEAPELYKKSALGLIPRDWEVQRIDNFADVLSGGTPSRTQLDRYFTTGGNGIHWVKTLDLNEQTISKTDEQITHAGLKDSSCALLPAGTVLVAMYGGWEQIGRTGLLGMAGACNQAISALIPKSAGRPQSSFLLYALQHGRIRWKQVAASTRKDPNITKLDVLNFLVPLPPMQEQLMISTRYESILARIAKERILQRMLAAEKSGLMDDLLTGSVRVTPLLEREPAEAT